MAETIIPYWAHRAPNSAVHRCSNLPSSLHIIIFNYSLYLSNLFYSTASYFLLRISYTYIPMLHPMHIPAMTFKCWLAKWKKRNGHCFWRRCSVTLLVGNSGSDVKVCRVASVAPFSPTSLVANERCLD